MSLELKTVGVAALAALAAGTIALLAIAAVASNDASAETGGHFTTDDTSGHTILKGEDKPANTTKIIDHTLGREIYCVGDVKYEGTITAQTVTELTLTPTLPTGAEGCRVRSLEEEGKEGEPIVVHLNGCDFVFTIGKSFGPHNTTHIKCPAGKRIEATVPSPLGGVCNVVIKPQTPAIGSGYYKGVPEEHEITIKPTLREIHAEYLGGLFKCGMANGATASKVTFDNRIRLKAFTTAGAQKDITATGPDDK